MTKDTLLTPQQVATKLHISPGYVRYLCQTGRMTATRVHLDKGSNGRDRNGVWRIRWDDAKGFKRSPAGPKPRKPIA